MWYFVAPAMVLGTPLFNWVSRLTRRLTAAVLIASAVGALPAYAQSGSDTSPLPLTEEETAWLAANPVITLAVDEYNPPVNYRDQNGRMRGIHVEYMRHIAESLGVQIEFVGSDWNTALERAMNHEVDGIINASPTEERRQRLNFSRSYFHTPDAVLSRAGAGNFETAQDFAGYRIAIIRGSIRVDVFRQYSPEAEIVEVATIEDAVTLLSEGQVDGVLDELAVIQNLLQEFHLPNLKLNALIFFPESGAAHVGLRNDAPILVSVFNKAIAAITQAEHQALRGTLLTSPQTVSVQNELMLTSGERRWLREHPIIRAGADPVYAPIEFRRPNGEFVGMSIDYLRLMGEKLGVTFRIEPDANWSQLIAMAKSQEIDLLAAMDETPVRQEYLSFTRPYIEFPVVVFTGRTIDYVADLNELRDHRIGAVRGYAEADWLQEDYPSFDLVTFDSITDGLRALNTGRIDAFVGNLVTTGYYLRQLGYRDIQVAGETDYSVGLSVAVRKDWPELVSILNKTLASLSESETRLIYQRWIPATPATRTDYRLLLTVVIVAAVVILVFVLWVTSLSVEIRKRNRALAELRETQEQLIRSEKLASIGTLVAGIAHELNNPLNFITTGISALNREFQRGGDPRTRDTLLEHIQEGAFRAADIVAGLKEYSRIARAQKTEVDINASIELALKLLTNEFREGIEVRFEPSTVPKISGFPGKLNQVFVNTILNSIESLRAADKSSNPVVTISTRVVTVGAARMVEVNVVDNGVGLDPESSHRLFDPFFSTKESGVGLGLSVSQQIIESHGGSIDAISVDGGAHFRIRLPVANGAGS